MLNTFSYEICKTPVHAKAAVPPVSDLRIVVEPFEAQNNVIESTINTQTYSKNEVQKAVDLPIVVEPIEAQKTIDLSIVVEPIEAQKPIDLPIVVEPTEAQTYSTELTTQSKTTANPSGLIVILCVCYVRRLDGHVLKPGLDYGLWTVDYGLWTMDYGLWTVDCGLCPSFIFIINRGSRS